MQNLIIAYILRSNAGTQTHQRITENHKIEIQELKIENINLKKQILTLQTKVRAKERNEMTKLVVD